MNAFCQKNKLRYESNSQVPGSVQHSSWSPNRVPYTQAKAAQSRGMSAKKKKSDPLKRKGESYVRNKGASFLPSWDSDFGRENRTLSRARGRTAIQVRVANANQHAPSGRCPVPGRNSQGVMCLQLERSVVSSLGMLSNLDPSWPGHTTSRVLPSSSTSESVGFKDRYEYCNLNITSNRRFLLRWLVTTSQVLAFKLYYRDY